jgi:hypothetical protein
VLDAVPVAAATAWPCPDVVATPADNPEADATDPPIPLVSAKPAADPVAAAMAWPCPDAVALPADDPVADAKDSLCARALAVPAEEPAALMIPPPPETTGDQIATLPPNPFWAVSVPVRVETKTRPP